MMPDSRRKKALNGGFVLLWHCYFARYWPLWFMMVSNSPVQSRLAEQVHDGHV
jgi:hypothetical protein